MTAHSVKGRRAAGENLFPLRRTWLRFQKLHLNKPQDLWISVPWTDTTVQMVVHNAHTEKHKHSRSAQTPQTGSHGGGGWIWALQSLSQRWTAPNTKVLQTWGSQSAETGWCYRTMIPAELPGHTAPDRDHGLSCFPWLHWAIWKLSFSHYCWVLPSKGIKNY